MATLTVGETVLAMDETQTTRLLNARTIVETDEDEYRLATFDEMYGWAGSPVRAPEVLISVLETLAVLVEEE